MTEAASVVASLVDDMHCSCIFVLAGTRDEGAGNCAFDDSGKPVDRMDVLEGGWSAAGRVSTRRAADTAEIDMAARHESNS
ncbi:hypothetical protein CH295_19605 [Rhodococcus sp. 14-2483-1-2]|nr:hypothetical protein CH295_19605 [Rhodococcus sp. 14-2483-1-2]